MSSWYNAVGYGWSGSYGTWYGRRRGSWGGKSEVRSEDERFCQKCSTGNWWSRTECRHCASVTNETAELPQTSIQKKTAVVERTLACTGNDESFLVGRGVPEKELKRHQKNLIGPKNTAKHVEAKQNWINRETKRVEAESVKFVEKQESVRVRKETLRVAYEEAKKLRTDLLREGELMDNNRSYVLSPESLEKVRNLEQQE